MEENLIGKIFATLGAILLALFILMLGKATFDMYFEDNATSSRVLNCQIEQSSVSYEDYAFSDSSEAVAVQEQLRAELEELKKEGQTLKTFTSLPRQTLKKICDKLLGEHEMFGISEIVTEYAEHQLWYETTSQTENTQSK